MDQNQSAQPAPQAQPAEQAPVQAAPVQNPVPEMSQQFPANPEKKHVGFKIAVAIIIILVLGGIAYFVSQLNSAPKLEPTSTAAEVPVVVHASAAAKPSVNPEDAAMSADLKSISTYDSSNAIQSINAEFK